MQFFHYVLVIFSVAFLIILQSYYSSVKMPSYKLTYFAGTGRAEVARILFSYGNIPFVDDRFKQEDWPAIKPTTPYGQVPVLEIDGEKFAQSMAISRYVANEVGLAGKDNKENLLIDSTVYVFDDISKHGMALWMEKDEEKKKEILKKYKVSLDSYFGKLEGNAKKNGGYLALPRLTWADIVFITFYEQARNQFKGEDILAPYPNLQKVKKNVLSQDKIKNWIKTRPENQMSPMKPVYNLKQDV